MVWSKLIQRLDFATSTISLFFSKQCTQVYYIYTLLRNDYSRVDWLSIVKIKPRGRNDEVTTKNDVCQIDKLVDAHRVALSIDLEENSYFSC
jgi:hypothetical protein